MRCAWAGLAVAVFGGAVYAQTADGPSFEVASVKPNPDGRGREQVAVSPGGITLRKASLGFCMQWAYEVRRDQITGPDWLNRERYDIDARAAGASTEGQLRFMLQRLLTERFRLALHRETRVLPIYEMTVAKGGPKLTPSKGDEESQRVGRDAYEITHITMHDFAERLRELGMADLPVVDRTGLSGAYDIELNFTPGWRPNTRPDSNGVSTFTLLERLGLKLAARKVPVEVLAIDHAERVPTAN